MLYLYDVEKSHVNGPECRNAKKKVILAVAFFILISTGYTLDDDQGTVWYRWSSRIRQGLPSFALITVHAAACRPVMQSACDSSQERNSSSGKIISLKNLPTGNLAVITYR
jgi:hypothetical protein